MCQIEIWRSGKWEDTQGNKYNLMGDTSVEDISYILCRAIGPLMKATCFYTKTSGVVDKDVNIMDICRSVSVTIFFWWMRIWIQISIGS